MITTIRAARKIEAVKRMNYLVEKRGFEILRPLQEVKTKITKHGKYNYRYGRYTSLENDNASCWYVQLKAPDRREA